MSDDAAPEALASPAPAAAARRWPRRVLLACLAGVAVVIVTVHSIGGRSSLIAGIITAAVIIFAAVIWRLPHLRRHFARPGGPRPPRTAGGWRHSSGFRRGGRGSGSGGGGLFRRASPKGGGRAGFKGSSAGTGGRRGLLHRSGTGRGGSLLRRGGGARSGMPGSGRHRRPGGTGPGRSLRHPFRGRGPSGAGHSGRRSLRHPLRRGASAPGGTHRPGASGGGRSLRHPFRRVRPAAPGGRRRGSAPGGTGGGGSAPAGRRRRWYAPWRRRASAGGTTAAKPAGEPGGKKDVKPGAKPGSPPSPPAVLDASGPDRKSRFRHIRKRYRRARKAAVRWAKPRWKARAGQPDARRLVTVTRNRRRPSPLAGRVHPRLRKAAAWVDALRLRRWWRHAGSPHAGRPVPRPAPAAVAAPVMTAAPGKPVSPVSSNGHGSGNGSQAQGGPARGGSHMWGKQGFAAVQDAIDTHIGNWDPDEAQDIEEFFGGFADYWRNQGATFSHLADRMGSELPIAAAVRDLVEEVAAACSIVGDRADEVYSAHRIEHETELERVENPRPGEEKWNV